MTPAARLTATLDLLAEIDKTPRPADALAQAYFRARRYIGSHDRSGISAMLYDILRHNARLGWWLDKNNAMPTPRMRLIAYLVLKEGKSAQQIHELFTGGKFAPPAADDAEKRLTRALENHTVEHPEMPEDVRAECPAWAASILKKRFGEDFAREMAALLEQAPLDLRANAVKTTRDAALAELKKANFNPKVGHFSPFSIRIEGRPNLGTLPLLKNGAIEIQDEGSQLVALLVDAKPGQRVVDFCAGAGGKTLAIAAQMNNKGRIIACDVLAKRLARSTERFRRAGLHNIEVKPLTSESDPWVKRHKESFDRVLTDAPCTGTGTWRRNPDQRSRLLGPGLENLLPLQAKILESAARLVKKGGRLIYATCSLLPEENEVQIEKFLAAHADFTLVDYSQVWKELIKTKAPCPGPYLSLTPLRHNTDGFFAAIMERRLS
jgi:16S rRNA (cytosine967-C5)-methyltransferase